MSQINFTTLKELKLNKKYEIMISCSLFRMKNSYRNFGIYVNSLLSWLPKIPKSAYVRLYVDASVISHPKYLKLTKYNLPKLEIVFFEAPDFMDSEGFHDGTFGSIVRLYPLFHPPTNADYVWTTDVDITSDFLNYNLIQRMKNTKSQLFYYSRSCYDKPWSENVMYPIWAGKIIMRTDVSLNKGNLTRYLNNVLKGEYKDIYTHIKNAYSAKKKMVFENIKYFPYGFDELFLNLYVYPEFINYRRIIFFSFGISKAEGLYEIGLPTETLDRYLELYYYSGVKHLNKQEYTEFIKLNNQIYEALNNFDFGNSEVGMHLMKCKTEFEEYKKYLSPISEDYGLYSIVIRPANKE